MSDADPPLLAIVDRLGKLEGLITGLHNSITQGQTSAAAWMTRVERLEQRHIELERRMVTVDHLRELSKKVDSLVSSDASMKGGRAVATWSIGQIVVIAGILITFLSVFSIGTRQPPAQAPPQHSGRQQ